MANPSPKRFVVSKIRFFTRSSNYTPEVLNLSAASANDPGIVNPSVAAVHVHLDSDFYDCSYGFALCVQFDSYFFSDTLGSSYYPHNNFCPFKQI